MNRIHRLVFSHRTQSLVAVAETSSARGRFSGRASVIGSAVAIALLALGSGQAVASCASGSIDTATTTTCVIPAGTDFLVSPTGSVTVNNAFAITNNGATVGSVSNAGTVAASGRVGPINVSGIYIGGDGTATGSIVNTGRLAGDIGIAVGDYTGGGHVGKGIVNSGHIDAVIYGIVVSGFDSSITGDIVNDERGSITNAAGDGIWINGSTVNGNLINHGLIDVGVSPITVDGPLSGSIVNSGVLRGHDSYYGALSVSGTVQGDLVNLASGLIVTTGDAYGAVDLSGGTIHGTVRNEGLIQGAGYAALYTYDNLLEGGIRNSGRIQGSGSSSYGIYFDEDSHIRNGVVNSGSIEGGFGGIALYKAAVEGGLVNTGVISTSGSTAIELQPGGVLDRIDNSGTISGTTYAIHAPSGLPQLNILGTGSRLIGDVQAANTNVTVKSGAVFSNSNAFNVNSFTVERGGLLNLGNSVRTAGSSLYWDGITVNAGFWNNGTVAVAAGATPSVWGEYNQAAGATLRIDLRDTTSNYGVLSVGSVAELADGTTIDVNVSSGASFSNGALVRGVVRVGESLNVTPSTLRVTDNSVLYNFSASTARDVQQLDLMATADPAGLVNAAGAGPAAASAAALQSLFNNGAPAAMQPVYDKLATLSAGQAADALLQTLPAVQGAGNQAGLNALHSMNKIIQARIEGSKGLSSGDEVPGRDGYLWARAFGNRGNQDDLRGASGFKSATNGLVLGADLPASDRLRAGLAFTVANSNITGNSSVAPSHVDVNTYEIVGYASYNLDTHTDINYQLDIGRNSAKSQRRIAFMGSTAEARFDSLALHGSVGIGRLIELSEASNLTPSLRLDYTQMRTGGYTETGAGPLSLAVAAQTYRELIASADVKFVHNFAPGLRFAGNATIGYDFRNERVQTAAAFTGGGPVFVTQGLESSPWIYRAGLGLIKEAGGGTEYSLRYDLEGRPSGYLNQTLSARVRWAF